jgi:predicted nucleic acid-binding protein
MASEAAAVLGHGDPPPMPWATVDFLDIECANVLASSARRGTIGTSYAEASLRIVAALPLVRWPSAAVLQAALRLSCEHGVSVHDACYVALADALGIPVITADDRLVRRLAGTRHAIVHLNEIHA